MELASHHNPRLVWRLAFGFLLVWIVAAALLCRWVASRPVPAGVSATDVGLATIETEADEIASLDDYRSVWLRPLRQQLIEPEKPDEPEPAAQDRGVRFALLGTAVEGARSYAILRDDRGGVVIAEIGSMVDTFVVDSIEADRVGLARDGQATYLMLPEPLRRLLPESSRELEAQRQVRLPLAAAEEPDASDPVIDEPRAADEPVLVLRLRGLSAERFMQDARLVPSQRGQKRRTGIQGFRIDSIAASSPLSGAGLRPGDVIVAVDGEALTRLHDLERIYAALDSRQPHQWRVQRGGQWVLVQLNAQEKHHEAI